MLLISFHGEHESIYICLLHAWNSNQHQHAIGISYCNRTQESSLARMKYLWLVDTESGQGSVWACSLSSPRRMLHDFMSRDISNQPSTSSMRHEAPVTMSFDDMHSEHHTVEVGGSSKEKAQMLSDSG